MCANGSKQRQWMSKEKSSSPTADLKSVILTAIIDAHEERDVATTDVPNAFIQTDHKGLVVYMKIKGQLVDIICKIRPDFKNYVTIQDKKKVVYVKMLKALYGMIESALLFYMKLKQDLLSDGFKLNPYDPCVANKTVKGKQFTLVWHVDDIKSLHVDSTVNDKFIQWLNKKYGKYGLVKATRGSKHDYIGIEFRFEEKKLKIDMSRYIKKMLSEFKWHEQLTKSPATPAATNLFETRDAPKLSEQKAEEFHSMVAKALFLSLRGRGDIQVAVAFLTTRVRDPDNDDWKKLIRMLCYLKETAHLITTLEKDKSDEILFNVDAAFAVHKDFKSHTGGSMTLGKGSAVSISIKQKLNTKSSTEAELVGVDDMTSIMLWCQYFLKEQGYDMNLVLNQDNTSTIKLLENGIESSTKRTRHINIRYYFLTDRIEKGELKVQYCSSDEMVADYFSKPLQGEKFMKFRKMIMNLE